MSDLVDTVSLFERCSRRDWIAIRRIAAAHSERFPILAADRRMLRAGQTR